MGTLAPRLKALSKRVALLDHGDPAVQAALSQLETSLDEVERLLPARQRGRPRQRELVPFLLCFVVDGLKRLPELGITTDREALRYYLRSQKGKGRIGSIKTLQNQLARARKSWH